MQVHNLIQGTPEWHAHRAQYFNASDAPAMMGCSPHKTRSQLLHEIATALPPEFDEATAKRFADGHRFEALARPLAERFIGEDLFACTGSMGKLSASFDGLTLDDSTGWEHKALNADLRAVMTPDMPQHALPLHYRVQMQQQMMVSGCARILFTASAWTASDELLDARHCWYISDPELAVKIEAGWNQFAADLKNYQPPAPTQPAPTAHAPQTLPALRIEVTGQVTASNLEAFKGTALQAIRSVNKNLQTDQDFADAEASVKWCSDVESRLAAAKEHALSQTASIDALFKAIDDISGEARRVRLDLDRLVKARKEAVRGAIVAATIAQYAAHLAQLNAVIGETWMPSTVPAFAEAIKGKKTVSSIQDAADTALAQAKIEANVVQQRILVNRAELTANSAFGFLFPDQAQLVLKQPEDLKAVIQQRVAIHEAKQLEAKRQQEDAAARAAQAIRVVPLPVTQAAAATPPVAPDSEARIKLGDMCARLGFTVTADFLADLGIPHVSTERAAKLYHATDFGRVCRALVNHIAAVGLIEQEATA